MALVALAGGNLRALECTIFLMLVVLTLVHSLAESKPDWRWQLTASGRFAHRKEYVQSVGEAHNLNVLYYEPMADFRFENGVGVEGHIFVMQKQKVNSGDQEL